MKSQDPIVLLAEISALKTRAHTQDTEIQRLSNELMEKEAEIERLETQVAKCMAKLIKNQNG